MTVEEEKKVEKKKLSYCEIFAVISAVNCYEKFTRI